MPMKECHGLAGRLSIELRDAGGRVVEKHRVDNLITNAGRNLLARLFAGAAQGPELRIAVGGQGGTVSLDDTALGDPLDSAPASIPSIALADHDGQQRITARVTATLPASGSADPQALQEAGILISLPGAEAVLYNRVTFPLINRAGNLEMTLTWEVIF
ncbi:MAG: hypothetical protein JSS57_17975 [Proteobacteria bacterium]|nr:hypothetical protein [Pseudomonadota bacterium]